MRTQLRRHLAEEGRGWNRPANRELRRSILGIGGLAALGLAVALAIWAYPEARRYLHVRRM